MGAYPTTHIANGCDCPIWAMCDTDRKHTISLNFGGQGVDAGINNANTNTMHQGIQPGFTRIEPGKYLGFKPKIGIFGANWINRNTVYITIEYELNDDNETKRVRICEAFPKASNESVIVANDRTIRATKMGYLWIDTAGNNHRPGSNDNQRHEDNVGLQNLSSKTSFTLKNVALAALTVYALTTTIFLIKLSPSKLSLINKLLTPFFRK